MRTIGVNVSRLDEVIFESYLSNDHLTETRVIIFPIRMMVFNRSHNTVLITFISSDEREFICANTSGLYMSNTLTLIALKHFRNV